jgi:heme-degrading monooxygenase HmoA
MTIARMWESRLDPERAADFVTHLRLVVWPALQGADGFVGGETYRSDDGELRAVLVTRWTDAASAAAAVAVESGLAAYCARDPHAWQFEQLDL